MWGESGFKFWGSGGPRSCYSCFTWIYLECGRGLACPPSPWWYLLPRFSSALDGLSPLVPPWVTPSRILVENREAELKPTTFSSILLFRVFLSFLFTWPSSGIVSWVLLLGFYLHFQLNLIPWSNHTVGGLCHVRENLFSNLQQMALLIIRKEISAICWEQTEIQFQCAKRL